MKYNSQKVGILSGIILPLITLTIFILFQSQHQAISLTIRNFFIYNVHTQVISLCALPNLLLFFIFMKTDRLLAARGVIGATLLITFIVLIIKFLL